MLFDLAQIQQDVTAWAGVRASPHRFGGIEFNLNGTEIGHIHSNGLVDIPFNRKIRNQLVAEHLAEPHHLLKDTGWISFYIRDEADVQAAIRLFRLSYLFYATWGKHRVTMGNTVNLAEELDALNVSPELRVAFEPTAVPKSSV